TLVTQTEVSKDDPAFANPTKFVGPVYTEERAKELMACSDKIFKADGNYFRRVVPSPLPKAIVEKQQVETLLQAGNVVIACGGGGVPVCREGERLEG
ncbi:carbamate kinase, partial [Vibrio natriegens]